MSSYSLDDIRAAADAKYGHTEITVDANTTVRLINALRLPKEKRQALLSVQDKLTSDDDVDQADVFADAIRTVADNAVAAEALIDAIGGDLAILAQVFSTYTEGTSAGEASASAN
jgi:peptide subunit release factor 1 (eRF1)